MAWRYLVFEEPSGQYAGEIELINASVTRTLSAPGRLTGLIPAGNRAELRKLLRPWHCSIYALDDAGNVRGGGFLPTPTWTPDGVQIDCVGRAGYPYGEPWKAAPYQATADPVDVVRRIWEHLQSQCSISVTVDAASCPIRAEVELLPWATTDLGAVIDDLAKTTPFEYLEHTTWAGNKLAHRLQLGYPTIGTRRQDLRFAIGENVISNPQLAGEDDDYASEIWGLGAGDGETMIRTGRVIASTTGVMRTQVMVDKTKTNQAALTTAARQTLSELQGAGQVHQVTLINHPNAPVESFDVGDEIFITGDAGLVTLDNWVRIIEINYQPDSDLITLGVK